MSLNTSPQKDKKYNNKINKTKNGKLKSQNSHSIKSYHITLQKTHELAMDNWRGEVLVAHWRRHGEKKRGRQCKKQTDDEKARKKLVAKVKSNWATGS